MPSLPPFSLLEACGGNGSFNDHGSPGACTLGPMTNLTDIKYSRLVFTPQNLTAPTILAMVNLTANKTTYTNSSHFWAGDY